MFAFWGEVGYEECNSFSKLSCFFSEIEPSPLICKFDRDFHVNIGQSPNPSFFPYRNAFTYHDMLYAVQGYLWTRNKLPENCNQTEQTIMEIGDEVAKNKTIIVKPERGGIYLLMVVNLKNKIAHISCDYSGLIPLYYHLTNTGQLLFSSHIRPLSKVLSARVDEVGIIHHSAFHHTIGKRTVFQGINRLNPGETLTLKNNHLLFSQVRDFYSQVDEYKSDDEAADVIWESYITGLKPFASIPGTRGIFLSGGFDTRLVVDAFSKLTNQITAVTFGDPENYEVEIAKRVCKLINAHQTNYPLIRDHDLDTDKVQQLIRTVEYVNFPYCFRGSIILSENGATTASTGYGGESFLGGQAYTLMGNTWSQKERFLWGITRSLGLKRTFSEVIESLTKEEIQNFIMSFYENLLMRNKKILINDFQIIYSNALNELMSDIEQELHRFDSSNPGTNLQILERFWIEHHVLKQFGRQELTIMANIPLILPTVFPIFLKKCSNLNPARKVDHGIYLKMVKRHLGDLAKIPTANIPISLMNPELLIWLSRAWRAKEDQKTMNEIMKSRGRTTRRMYGWSNFEVWLRESNFFDTCLDFISPEIFSYGLLNDRIHDVKLWKKRVYSGQDYMTMITLSQITR